MRRSLAFALTGLLLVLAAPRVASAGGELFGGPPPDTRRDWYEIPAADDDLLLWAGADIFKTDSVKLSDNGDGTHDLTTFFWNNALGGPCPCANPPCPPCPACPQCALCPEARFRGQQRGGNSTGILVGRQLVMTPFHTIGDLEHCQATSFVFDHFQLAANDPPVIPGGGASSITIPNGRIYHCIGWERVPGYDMVVVTLDRPVTGRRPVKLNRYADIEAGTEVVLFGHPKGLPLKVEDGVTTNDLVAGASSGFNAQVHSIVQASGSMLLERASGKLIGMGTTVSNWLACDPTCCTDNPDWHLHPMGLQNVAAAAYLIPPVGLQVEPGARVVESFGPPWGPFTNATTEYTVSVPFDEPSALSYAVTLENTPEGLFELGGSLSGILAPGRSATFTVGLVPRRGQYPIGVFDSVVRVADPVYKANDLFVHRVRSGIDGFTFEPMQPFVGDGPGAFPEDQKLYSIDNLYEQSPLTVEARTSASWIRLNGQAGATNVDMLMGEQADLLVSFEASSLPNGVFSGTVELEQVPYNGQPVCIEVLLDVGRSIFENDVPVPIGASGAVMAIATPTGGFFMDVDVEIDITLETGPGLVPVIEIWSPLDDGVRRVVRLWEGGSIGHEPLSGGGGSAPTTLEFDTIYDDTTHPAQDSLAPLSYATYEGGGWELHVFERDGNPLPGGEITRAAVRATYIGL